MALVPWNRCRRVGFNGNSRAANLAETIEDLWRTHADAPRERRVALITVYVEQAMRIGWKIGKGFNADRDQEDED